MEKFIIINNNQTEVIRVIRFLEELNLSLNIPPINAMSINLAIEEIIRNIIQKSYPEGQNDEIKLMTKISPGKLTFQIANRGVVTDPFYKDNINEKRSLEEQITNGLGQFLIHRTMDKVTYQTIDGQHQLTLSKNINIEFKPGALLKTNICRVDDIIVLDIDGRLDTVNSRDFTTAIQPLLQEHNPNIIVNCEKMSYISSSGLRAFIILLKSVLKNKGTLIIEAMQPDIKHIFEMTGCATLFNIR